MIYKGYLGLRLNDVKEKMVAFLKFCLPPPHARDTVSAGKGHEFCIIVITINYAYSCNLAFFSENQEKIFVQKPSHKLHKA